MKLPVFGPKNRKVKFRDILLFNQYKSDDKVCMYRITDKETDKSYIGQTFDTKCRLHKHRDSGPFSELLQEKGYTSIHFEILEQDVNVEDADDRERHYVSLFNTLEPNGYNKVTGGKKGGKMSDLLRKDLKERAITQGVADQVSVKNKELFQNEDFKEKHKSSLNDVDVQNRRSTSRKIHYDEKRKQMLPQFKMYYDEYKGYGSMKTIMNLMKINMSMYYKLLEEVRRIYIVS